MTFFDVKFLTSTSLTSSGFEVEGDILTTFVRRQLFDANMTSGGFEVEGDIGCYEVVS